MLHGSGRGFNALGLGPLLRRIHLSLFPWPIWQAGWCCRLSEGEMADVACCKGLRDRDTMGSDLLYQQE